jgi:hypothetical protein
MLLYLCVTNFQWLFPLEFIVTKSYNEAYLNYIVQYMLKLVQKYLLLVLFIFWTFSFFNITTAYQEILIENRGWHAIRVIKVILDWEHFVVSSVASEWWETIQSLTKKVWWVSAINWAFFCPKDYSSCDTTFSYYERVFKWDGASYSQFWPDTSIRWIFWFTIDWTPLFVQNKISDSDVGLISNINSKRIWDLYFWISNFPVLLINGDDVTIGASEYIDSKMTWKWNRNFICSTKDGKTIYMWVIWTISVRDMAKYLKEQFWCYNALFLDAWASSAMVYSWAVLDQWSRKLITDAFVVVDRDTFKDLGWKPSNNYTPYKWAYQMNESDLRKVDKLKNVVDVIYESYWKTRYKTKLISMFRSFIRDNISESQRAIYNQVLIYLFTIENL